MRKATLLCTITIFVSGCAMSSGIIRNGQDVFTVSEMRAPARGGFTAARLAALQEAQAFCAQGQRVFVPLMMAPGGDPYSYVGPTSFTTTFRCVARK